MLTKRIIPCLDVKDGKVVKGINFVGLKEVGAPVELAKKYYQQGADELVFLDITATSDGRETMVKVVEDVAKNIIKPLKGSVKSNNILQLARKKNIYKFREIEQSLYLDTPNNAYIEETMSNGFIDDFNNFIEVMEDSINAKENAPIAGFLDEFSIATAQVIRSIIDKINNWYPNLNGIL